MKTATLIGIALLASALQTPALVGVTSSVQGSNVVLSWPSTTSSKYLIQYRATLNTNDSWADVTNNYPAALNTNRTVYFIYGVIPPPPTNSGGGGSTNPPPPGFDDFNMTVASTTDYKPYPLDDATVQYLASRHVFPPYGWDREQRNPYIWELEVRPPWPWEFDLPVRPCPRLGRRLGIIFKTSRQMAWFR